MSSSSAVPIRAPTRAPTRRGATLSTSAVPTAQLASFDYPALPSPAAAPAANAAGSAKALAGACERLRLRELAAARSEIDREKIRRVAPYPFFGRAMRFQDEFAALQISEDGRFSYSILSLEASSADATSAERDGGGEGGEAPAEKAGGALTEKRIVTYEGIFAPAPGELPAWGHGAGASRSHAASSPQSAEEAETACIDGVALVRHDVEEHLGGAQGPKLACVERAPLKFSISISPWYQPTTAVVSPPSLPRTPGRPCLRTKQLPYVGNGGPTLGTAQRGSLKLKETFLRRRATGILNLGHVASSASSSTLGASTFASSTDRRKQAARSLGSVSMTTQQLLAPLSFSASAPQLGGKTCGTRSLLGSGNPPSGATDWKEFYRRRAEHVFQHLDSGCGGHDNS